MAAGDSYAAGGSGGEAEHTLTIDEMPSHNHEAAQNNNNVEASPITFNSYDMITPNWIPDGTSIKAWYTYTSDKGGSQPHNNMPPYLTYYCWERIS